MSKATLDVVWIPATILETFKDGSALVEVRDGQIICVDLKVIESKED